MSSEREEVIVDPDALQPEHLRERGAQQLFLKGHRTPATAGRVRGGGQSLAVQLPIHGQRQCVQDDHR
ncbi:hypothetical protein [Streptomyces sp. Ncost-T10-10d]|uniref:hypothetical protein n=1 Tax=Streptomyces sp. Ncost-T10-10d TaxID=1839774 RepID=UPI00210EF91B|nr:hypothetical protein [Streptomyces sp. Ncost-T10-10d]